MKKITDGNAVMFSKTEVFLALGFIGFIPHWHSGHPVLSVRPHRGPSASFLSFILPNISRSIDSWTKEKVGAHGPSEPRSGCVEPEAPKKANAQ